MMAGYCVASKWQSSQIRASNLVYVVKVDACQMAEARCLVRLKYQHYMGAQHVVSLHLNVINIIMATQPGLLTIWHDNSGICHSHPRPYNQFLVPGLTLLCVSPQTCRLSECMQRDKDRHTPPGHW